MASKSDSYYMKKALKEIDYLIRYTKNIEYDELVNDIKTLDATIFRLIQLVEQLKKLSSCFKNHHAEIPWGKIIGFRNGLVHEYGHTDYLIVYEVVGINIYDLKALFESYVN